MKKMKKNAKGFTLIELLVVVAIIGILAAVLVPGLMSKTADAKIKSSNSNAQIVYNSAANAMQQAIIDDVAMPAANTVIKSTDAAGGLADRIKTELGSTFTGNWEVTITPEGNATFACWSKNALAGHAQMDNADQKSDKGKVGCYPLK